MKRILSIAVLLFTANLMSAQSTGDCAGAIPICTNSYTFSSSAVGDGNVINEFAGCLDDEHNSTWFYFTGQSTGQVGFEVLASGGSGEDYDWAVWDISVSGCAGVTSTPISCNWSGTNSVTGPNGGTTQTSGGAADNPQNAFLNVTQGNTYAILIDNFAGTSTGFTVDFGVGNSVLDVTSPTLTDAVVFGCGTTTVNLTFSENIECSSISPGDFTITGPGGPYSVLSVNSPQCGSPVGTGSFTQDFNFTLTLNTPISTPGTYTISIGNNAVTDLCGNGNPAISYNFGVPTVGFNGLPASMVCTDAPVGFINNDSITANGVIAPCMTLEINPVNGNSTNTVTLLEDGTAYWGTNNLNANTNSSTLFYNISPGATHTIQFTNTAVGTAMDYVMYDCLTGAVVNSGTWVVTSTGTQTLPVSSPGTFTGSSSYSSTCGGIGTTDWGFGQFDPSGVTGPFPASCDVTYTWNSGNGCSGSETQSVTITSPNDASFNYTTTTYCSSDSDPSPNITGSGLGTISSTGGLSINSSGVIDISASTPGTYTVTHTVGSGNCADIQTTSITINPDPTANAGSTLLLDCNGPTGNLSGSGGGTYSWAASGGGTITSGAGTATPTVSTAGTYTLTVTVNGCTDTDVTTVTTDFSTPTANAGSPAVINCFNQATGVGLSGSGGGSYAWTGGTISSGANTATPTVTAAGTYTLTVTGTNGCTDTDVVTVTTDFTAPAAGAGLDGLIDCANPTATLTATGGGTYSWAASGGGSIVSGGSTANVVTGAAGTYTVTVMAANGCTDTDVALVTADISVPIPDAGLDQVIDCNNPNVTLTASGGVSYVWSPGGQTTPSISVSTAGTYTVTVTGGSGCDAQDAVDVTIYPTPTAAISGGGYYCAESATPDVVIDLTGTGPWTVTYSNGTNSFTVNPVTSPYTISNGADGNYTLTSASDASCPATLSGSATITTNPLPIAVVTGGGTVCANEPTPDVTITITGTSSPWTFDYFDGTNSTNVTTSTNPYIVSGGADGVYSVTNISDVFGCIGSANGSATIITNPLPTANISGGGTICSGSAIPDVSIALTGAAPWSITYFDGTNSTTVSTNSNPYVISNGIDGPYTVTNVSDINCIGVPSGVATILTNDLPTAVVSGGGIICDGVAIPDITFTFTGTSPWNVTYTDGVTPTTVTVNSSPFILSNATDGNYSIVSFTDATTCSGTSSGFANISTNPLPSAVFSGGGTICAGDPIPDVTITLTGSGPWTIGYTDGVTPGSITTSANPYTVSNGVDGSYTLLSVTDATTCPGTVSGTATILTNPIPAIPNAGTDSTYCLGENIVDLFAIGTGGTLNWYSDASLTTNVGTGNSLPPTNAVGSYTYYVTETIAGCESPDSLITITINDVPVIDLELAADVTLCGVSDGSIQITVSGGTPAYTYSIDGGATFSAGISPYTFSGLGVNAYQVVVADQNCQTTGSLLTIIGPGVPAQPIAGVNAVYCQGDVIAALTATGTNISWYDDPAGTNLVGNSTSFTPPIFIGDTNYLVTQTVAGCESAPVVINIVINPTPLAPIPTGGNTYCEGDPIADLNAPPGIGGTIEWFDDAGLINSVGTGQVFSPVNAVGTYSYYVNETLNGCTGDSSRVDVTINPTPSFTVAETSPTTCLGTDGQMVISGLVPGNTYDVSYTENGSAVPAVSMTADGSGNILISGLSEGTFTTVTVDLNGCSSVDAGIFNLIDPPMPVFTLQPNSPTTCAGSDGSLVLSGLDINTTYNISYLDDGVPVTVSLTSDGTGDIVISSLDAGVYTDVAVTLTACTTTLAGPYVLTDPNAPVFSIGTITNPSGCGIADASITINGLDPNTTYNLSYDVNGVPFGPVSITTDGNGDYIISGIQGGSYTGITIELSLCSSTDPGIYPLVPIYPTAPIAFTDSTYCQGDFIVDLNGIGAFGGTMAWYDVTGNNVGSGPTYTVLDTSPGTHIYGVTETLNFCEGDTSWVTTVILQTPTAPGISTDATYCDGDPMADLVVTPQGTGTIIWYSDSLLTDSIGTGVNYTPLTGVDTVTYYVVETVGGCVSSYSSTMVVVNPNPVAAFTPTPSSGSVPLDVYLDNTSTGGDTYSWDLGDGTTSTLFDPSVTYTGAGDYTVILFVTDLNNCLDSTSATITVEGTSTLIVPNIFTPNGDGNNDVFNLSGTNITEITGTIMNRWGQVVYQFNTVEAGWTGRTVSGLEAAEGTYYYIIDAVGVDGVEYDFQGPFQLIR